MLPIVEIVAHRWGDRLRHPVQRQQREQKFLRKVRVKVAGGVAPRAPLFENPGRESGGRIALLWASMRS
jgi:hypothetical protein